MDDRGSHQHHHRRVAGGIAMTQEHKRIKIAEACGYRTGYRDPEAWHPLPDLNAMHEAEKTLTDAQYKEYCALLDEAGYDDRGIGYPNWSRSATAAQRAEAFGRTLGLWT